MEKIERNIFVLLNGNVVANCMGLDVAQATVDGILTKIQNSDNFTITIQKQTRVLTDTPKETKDAPKLEDGPELMDKKENPTKEAEPAKK